MTLLPGVVISETDAYSIGVLFGALRTVPERLDLFCAMVEDVSIRVMNSRSRIRMGYGFRMGGMLRGPQVVEVLLNVFGYRVSAASMGVR